MILINSKESKQNTLATPNLPNIIGRVYDIILDIEGNIVESDPVMVPTFIDIDGDDDPFCSCIIVNYFGAS